MATVQRLESPAQKSPTIDELRAQAQANLASIEAERVAEQLEQARRAKESEPYIRTKNKTGNRTSSEAKSPRLRTAEDVLDRLRHDPNLKIEDYVIGYLERFEGIKEMEASTWVSEVSDEEFVPLHRIKYFKRRKEIGELVVVWHRERRIDMIFGSGLGEGVKEDENS